MDLSYWGELSRQMFFLTSAGLGALFAALYPVTIAASNGTHDENNDAGYVMRVVVGLISGTILGQLINIGSVGGLGGLTRPTLALVGGFSASLVFKILTRLVHSIESVFSDIPEERRDAAASAADARAEIEIVAERQAIVRRLLSVQSTQQQGTPAFIALDELIGRILRGEV